VDFGKTMMYTVRPNNRIQPWDPQTKPAKDKREKT